ncbi:type II secretion system protein [Microbacterium limosum]|uniref:Type II secretion system protein n=1 Tax=Microbacterium limosum TaxID=3079935 RepID=A0AAU0MJJ9_9MICO|nr:type II secretion system protein [Microbacterium sp. Y20]WOQ70427.1 type II secretion system protein [Microbacterium sp. Y20]
MRKHDTNAEGFTIVEVIVAMFLLAVVAVAILPALWQGVRLSSQQSAVATATRELNALVEQARENPTCEQLFAVAETNTVSGAGRTFNTSGTVGACAAGEAVRIELQAVAPSGSTLTTVTAIVYVP